MSEDLTFLANIVRGSAKLQQIPLLTYRYNTRDLVYQCDKVRLYHYHPKTKKPHTTPLLVVFATVNRPEILDLFPEHSFIGGLLENGLDVYLLDWGYPDLSDKAITFDDYVTQYLHHCVKQITKETKHKSIDLLGICQGGLMCVCYAAMYDTTKNLVLISTPIDFHTSDNTIAKFLNVVDINLMTEIMGNVSGAWLTQFFISLRPFELIGKKYLRFVDHIEDDVRANQFLQVEKWLYDAPDQTGASFRSLANDFYRSNKLIKGKMSIQNNKVDLANIMIPILNIMASEDEIVPMSASSALKKYVGSKDYSEQIFPSGHIGIYISDKVGKKMSTAIASWLKKRS